METVEPGIPFSNKLVGVLQQFLMKINKTSIFKRKSFFLYLKAKLTQRITQGF